jgi:hypothetical protein
MARGAQYPERRVLNLHFHGAGTGPHRSRMAASVTYTSLLAFLDFSWETRNMISRRDCTFSNLRPTTQMLEVLYRICCDTAQLRVHTCREKAFFVARLFGELANFSWS